MGGAKKQTSFMIPEDLQEVLQAKAMQEHTSAAEIMRQALKHYLGLSTNKSPLEDEPQLEELKAEVRSLKKQLTGQITEHKQLTEQITEHNQQLLAIRYRLEQLETVSGGTTKRTKSLKPNQPSTKPHNAVYGRGEAASIYPGSEFPASVSYVFDRFQALNTDEARAAFADKWIGLCAQSLDAAWVMCYKLLSIIKEDELYKISHWMEGNKTYNSFKDYFENRFKKPFETWLKLELNHQFVVENYPELPEQLLLAENRRDRGANDAVNPSKPNGSREKTGSYQLTINGNGGASTNRAGEVDEGSDQTTRRSPLHKESRSASKETLQKRHVVEQEDTNQATEFRAAQFTIMAISQVSEFSGLTKDQLQGRKKRGKLPVEVLVDGVTYSIDCTGKDEKGQNQWSVKPIQQIELNNTETQASTDDFQTEPLSQYALAERLNVSRNTLITKQSKMSESEFADWTDSKDPNGIAWKYSEDLKKYCPVVVGLS